MVYETTETDRWAEYEFTLANGQKRYEIIDHDSDLSPGYQIAMFMNMHGATFLDHCMVLPGSARCVGISTEEIARKAD